MRSESNQDEAPIESHVDKSIDENDFDDAESQNSFGSRGDFDQNDYGSESEDNSNDDEKPILDTSSLDALIKSVDAASKNFNPV